MRPRIVVFEDDAAFRKLITLILQQEGYEVVSAADPTLCPLYTKPEQECPHEEACGDFLLTDNRMPHMSGLEFVACQSRRGCKGVMANKAVISANWSPEDLARAAELGCKIFRKPFKLEEILAWIEERKPHLSPARKLVSLDPPEA